MMPKRAIVAFALAVAALIAAILFAPDPASSFAPAVTAAGKAPLVVIWMENHERSAIIGSSSAPYMNQLANTYRDFTHYYAVTHPSLPNYLTQGNGSTNGKSGSDSITAGAISGSSLWGDLQNAGVNWKVYMESMPSNCYSGGGSGQYVLRHNWATPYAQLFSQTAYCQAHVQPWTANAPLAPLTFIAPNLCNDMHDCSVATGNGWLANVVPGYLAQGAKVIITFDEGGTSDHGGGNVYMVVAKQGMKHSVRTGTFTHYSLLAAIEDRFGLQRRGNAVGIAKLPI
jgi:phosphatidylinositol-3-phosphatase